MWQVKEYLGSAAFSKAVQCLDLQTGEMVCIKIIRNNKDFFDQSLDEIKLLRYLKRHDPNDSHHVLQVLDYFYHKVGAVVDDGVVVILYLVLLSRGAAAAEAAADAAADGRG